MKKIIIIAAVLLTLITPISVNAGIKNTTSCEDSTVDSNGKLIRVCYIDIDITNTTRLYKITGKLTFNNSSLKSIEALDSRLQMANNDSQNLVFESKTAIEKEKIRLAKVTIYIGLDGTECNTKWQPTEYGINYSCDIVDGEYYDLNGKLTDFATYDKQCNKHYCEVIDNEYYDSNGNIVTEKEYNKACGKYSCTIVNNEYYNSEGKIVTEKEYNKDCGKYSCVIVDNEYYDGTGNLIDKTTWEEMCTIPENPTTGSESIIAAAIIGVITLIFIIIATKKTNKLYKI